MASTHTAGLLERLEELERDLRRDVRRAQKRFRQSIPVYLRESRPLNLLSIPFVYSVLLPIAVLDVWVSVYQCICFPLFGIRRVNRASFIVIDRYKLAYLNGIEKLNCFYCSYANGVFAYAQEVAGRTEQYWCPIQHSREPRQAHRQYRHFVRYGDAAGYHRRLPELRRALKKDR